MRAVVCLSLLAFFGSFLSARAQAPTINPISPTTFCQGDPITITGANFTGATAVRVGSLNAASFSVIDDNNITAVIADFATSGTVSVTNPSGTGTTPGGLTIKTTPKPKLTDVGTLDIPFANCDNSITYQLKVANASTVPAPTGNQYLIDWGDGTGQFTQTDWPSGAQTTHTYTAQGYFTITMTITPTNGCPKTITIQFYNGRNPLASFTTTNSTTGLCTPSPIEFQVGNWFNNSPGTTYQFDYGDGSPVVSLTHPLEGSNTIHLISHIYTKSSCPNPDFTATLRATNGCFTTTYTLNQIIIRQKPQADFTTQTNPVCISTPVCFTNQTINGYSGTSCNTTSTFTWDFGDGTPTSNAQTPPCHTYASAGPYTVTLTASNIACGMSTKTKQIDVLPTSPPPTVSATPPVYCQGQPAIPLTATGTGLLWYTTATGGTGSPTAPTPPTTTPGARTWWVSQTLANECESQRISITVTVNALPAAPIVTSPVQLCLNQAASPLTASGANLLWYAAPTGGAGSATAPTPSTTSTGSMSYYVSQTNNGCEGPRATIVVTVNSIATAPVVVSPLTYCQNQTAAPLTATGANLLWYTSATGGIGSPTAFVPSTTSPGSTDYYVSQVSGCGESPRSVITVTINPAPSAAIGYTPAILCNVLNTTAPNPPVAVTLTGATGGTFSVTPTGLSVNPSTGEINPSGATAATYTIRYTLPATGGCAIFFTTATITVSGSPNASVSYPLLCTSDAVTRPTFTGTSGGAFTSSAGLTIDPATGMITPATSTPGPYVVTYTIAASPPCPGFTTTANVRIDQAPSASISYTPAVLCNVLDAPATPNPSIPVIQTGTPGGAYSIVPANGLSVNPSTGTINPSGATPGPYTIKYTIPGIGGCSNYTVTTSVTVNGTPTAVINYPGAPFCRGLSTPQSVNRSGTAGGTYSSTTGLSINATTGAIDPSLSQPGPYIVTYTVAASAPCPGVTTTTTVQIDDSPVLTFPLDVQSICSGGTADFLPSSSVPNTTYGWSVVGTLPANVSGVSSGTATGANATISLTFTNTGSISQTIKVRVIPTNPSQNPCPGTPYLLTLTINPIPAAPRAAATELCMGSPTTTLTVNPLPGTTVNWYDNNGALLSGAPAIPTNLPASFIYYASQTNSYGCESPRSKITSIVHPTPKIVGSAFTNPTTCGIPSGSISLQLLDLNDNALPNLPLIVHYDKFNLPYTIAGSTNAAGKVTIPLVAGTYTNIYVEASGCSSQKIPDVFILRDPTPPAQPVAGYNPPICSESILNLTALTPTSSQAGPIDYVWAGPAFGPLPDTVSNTVISFPSAPKSYEGTYVVYALQNNCISLPTNFEVMIKQSPSKPLIVTRNPLCIGDDLSLQSYSSIPGPGYTLQYAWRGPGTGFPTNTPNAGIRNVKLEDGGIYSITVTSPETGCSSTTDTLIRIGGYPIVKFPKDTLTLPTGFLLKLEPAILNAANPGILPMQQFVWTPSSDLNCNDAVCATPIATIKNNVCYAVKAINTYGCSSSDTICIKVFCQSSQIFIPNAFTPRGGIAGNRKLVVRATGISSVRSFRVFNRWGKIMFERNNFPPNSPDFGWDGTVDGRPADPGVYVYIAEVVCENGVPYEYKGNVTIL